MNFALRYKFSTRKPISELPPVEEDKDGSAAAKKSGGTEQIFGKY
jgi:hypothetical protein